MSADRPLPLPPDANPVHDSGERPRGGPCGEPDGAADLAAALDAATCLGPWTHELPADSTHVASLLGEALGLALEERAGVPLARVLSCLHDEDRPRVEAMLAAARETGGSFEAELRTRSVRETRYLRLMGRAEIDASARTVRTRGLAFDLTESRLGRGSPPLQAQWQLNQVAGHVIAMKSLVEALDSPSLARLLDRMAVETGFELARHLGQAQRGARH